MQISAQSAPFPRSPVPSHSAGHTFRFLKRYGGVLSCEDVVSPHTREFGCMAWRTKRSAMERNSQRSGSGFLATSYWYACVSGRRSILANLHTSR